VTTETLIGLLKQIQALEALEFFVSKSDNRDAEINCRLWTLGASKERCEQLAAEINAALAPVVQQWVSRLHEQIAGHYREQDGLRSSVLGLGKESPDKVLENPQDLVRIVSQKSPIVPQTPPIVSQTPLIVPSSSPSKTHSTKPYRTTSTTIVIPRAKTEEEKIEEVRRAMAAEAQQKPRDGEKFHRPGWRKPTAAIAGTAPGIPRPPATLCSASEEAEPSPESSLFSAGSSPAGRKTNLKRVCEALEKLGGTAATTEIVRVSGLTSHQVSMALTGGKHRGAVSKCGFARWRMGS